MDKEEARQKLKQSPTLKKLIDWLVMHPTETRPRWYIRMLSPLYQHRGRGSFRQDGHPSLPSFFLG